jgi:hypothetical protein
MANDGVAFADLDDAEPPAFGKIAQTLPDQLAQHLP